MADALAPRRCAGCGMPAGEVICEACVELCGLLPVPRPRPTPFGACHAALPFVPPVRGLVHHAKYRGSRASAAVLGALVVERLCRALQAAPAAVVVPVPLGPRRQRSRGYNQATLLATALARRANLPLLDGAARVRETVAQVGRDGEARRANVAGAFAWRGPPLPPAATVWLVDDVVTTGATMAAAATALRHAGAGRIDCVAAAMVCSASE